MLITRVQHVRSSLEKAKGRFGGLRPDVIVGYTAAYALQVHENLEARHKEGKQAKYLEEPASVLRPELKQTIRAMLRTGATLEDALLVAGMQLQRASQKVVPIDTGNLRGSAFTEKAQ